MALNRGSGRFDASAAAIEHDLMQRAMFVEEVAKLQREVARRAHQASLSGVADLEQTLAPYRTVYALHERPESFIYQLRESVEDDLRNLMNRNSGSLLRLSDFVGCELGDLLKHYGPRPEHRWR